MNLENILTEEELKDCLKQQGITGSPNYDVIIYHLEKHIMRLDTGLAIELMKLHELDEIRLSLEYLTSIAEERT